MKKPKGLYAVLLGTVAIIVATSARTDTKDFIIVAPEQIAWRDVPNGKGLQTAVVAGDPSKSGVYVVRVKFPPGVMTRPHTHPEDRYAVVLKGTWWVGTSAEFEPGKTTPVKTGSFMKHPAGGPHYDGAKDEEVIVQITGVGPSGTDFLKPELGPVGASTAK
ncbi:MAG: cupin domain-containing protein [Sulfurifustaceae bacterium]